MSTEPVPVTAIFGMFQEAVRSENEDEFRALARKHAAVIKGTPDFWQLEVNVLLRTAIKNHSIGMIDLLATKKLTSKDLAQCMKELKAVITAAGGIEVFAEVRKHFKPSTSTLHPERLSILLTHAISKNSPLLNTERFVEEMFNHWDCNIEVLMNDGAKVFKACVEATHGSLGLNTLRSFRLKYKIQSSIEERPNISKLCPYVQTTSAIVARAVATKDPRYVAELIAWGFGKREFDGGAKGTKGVALIKQIGNDAEMMKAVRKMFYGEEKAPATAPDEESSQEDDSEKEESSSAESEPPALKLKAKKAARAATPASSTASASTHRTRRVSPPAPSVPRPKKETSTSATKDPFASLYNKK